MTKICIPIKTSSLTDLTTQIKVLSSKADVIEIWLGEFFQEPGLVNHEEIIQTIFTEKENIPHIPFLFTIKGEKEQGSFKGTNEETKILVRSLIEKRAEYIDLDYEFDMENDYAFFTEIKELQKQNGNTQLITSAHFFEGTPSFPSLKNRVQNMQNRGADIVKIAAMPESPKDVLTILRLSENLQRKKIKHITISMGDIGKISRIASSVFDGEMMFASSEEGCESASGQITVSQLRDVFTLLG